jgi:formylglycine-generating enzyme required for sulfatase activity
VRVGSACIDKYEESVWLIDPVNNLPLVSKVQSGTATLANLNAGGIFAAIELGAADSCNGSINNYGANFPLSGDWWPIPGSNPPSPGVYAVSIPGVQPSACISWFQAEQACALSGKRLATNQEWQRAAAGTPDPGTDNGTTDCNINSPGPSNTGSRSNCKSAWGVFDMVGNLQEWVADWTEISQYGGCTNSGTLGLPGSDYMCFRGYWEEPGFPVPNPAPAPLIRGGEFDDGTGAGVFAVWTGDFPSDFNYGTGFRCARPAL